jgi:peroxiredoxin Q/BCP
MRLNEIRNPQVGALVEDFTLPDSTGTPRTLSSLLTDGSLLLIFYRGYWWPFCLRQLAEFRDLSNDFRGLGVHIAAVAVDSPERSDRVRRQYELPFPILCDAQKEVVRAWSLFNAEEKGGIAIPAVLLLGRDRRFRLIMIEGVSTRVRAVDLLSFLRSHPVPANSADDIASDVQRQRVIFPSLVDFGRAIWNSLTKP